MLNVTSFPVTGTAGKTNSCKNQRNFGAALRALFLPSELVFCLNPPLQIQRFLLH